VAERIARRRDSGLHSARLVRGCHLVQQQEADTMSTPKQPEGRMFSNLLASKPKKDSGFAATATSAVVHGGLIAALVYATAAAGGVMEEEEDVVMLIPVQEEEPPPPPPPPPPPEVQVEDVPPVEVPQGFQTLTVPTIVLPDIPPPRIGAEIREQDFTGRGVEGGRADGNPELKKVEAEDISAAPSFTPFTTEPRLRNTDEVARVLERTYPPLLRDAGIGGTTIVWFFIDEQGKVVNTKINTSSGYEALDEAALKVANMMQFTPAKNRDQIVRVWVQIPIKFTAK
jgi:protein TonB